MLIDYPSISILMLILLSHAAYGLRTDYSLDDYSFDEGIDTNPCGTRMRNTRNGLRNVAYKGESPWNVVIYTKLGKSITNSCGGSIISQNFILTAAHCISHMNPSNYLIGVGSNDLLKTINYTVQSIHVHPKYDEWHYHFDLALIKLSKNLTYNDSIRPICLPLDRFLPDSDSTPESVNLTISGWGSTEYQGKRSRILLRADLKLVSRETCNNMYSSFGAWKNAQQNSDDFICAGKVGGKGDACEADGGGPLIAKLDTDNLITPGLESKFIQIGIVSFGYKCGAQGFPGVYTNVHKHLKWIEEEMKKTPRRVDILIGMGK